MADVTVTYNGQNIIELSETGRKTLKTAKKRCKTDIEVAYIKSGGDTPVFRGSTFPPASLGVDGNFYIMDVPIQDDVNFVEYLENSGDAYINTGIYATQDIDAEVKGNRGSGSSTLGCMLGVRTGGFGDMKKTLYFGSHGDNNGGVSVCKSGTSSYYTAVEIYNHTGVVTRRTKTIKNKNNSYTYVGMVDGEWHVFAQTQSGSWRSDSPLCMFRFYNGSTLSGASPTKIIRVSIFERNVPIADYIPCLDPNGVACMWDNIAREYVYNSGTGNFIAGNSLASIPDRLDSVMLQKIKNVWQEICWAGVEDVVPSGV